MPVDALLSQGSEEAAEGAVQFLERLPEMLEQVFVDLGLAGSAGVLSRLAPLLGLVIVAVVAHFLAGRILVYWLRRLIRRSRFQWDDPLAEHRVFFRLAHLVPALILYAGSAIFFAEEKATNFGIFVQAELDLTDRFRLSTGARYDFQEFEGIDGTTYDNDGLSANISGDYDVSDALTLSAGASHNWGGIALAESFLFDPAWTYPASIEPVTSVVRK